MKKINLLLVFCLAILTFAQAQIPPQAFNYSAVARNAAGQPIATSTIGIKISILKTSTLGTAVYSENHFVNTDAFGLFNLVIGGGAVQSGSMSTIDWSNDNYYLKVGMDATGGTNFLTMGTTQLLSVPYAMHAATADSIIGGIVNETDPIFTNSIAAAITATDTTNWNTDVSATNELQTISISNDTIYLSNGGFVRLPNISGGKTYIELFGDVTNAQADSILIADLGQNTQFVYITGTTQLTSVNLTGVTSLIELKISDNPLLTSVSLPSLTRCSQTFRIENNNALTTLNIPLLASNGDFLISSNPTLATISANVLIKAKIINIQFNGLTSISFPALTTMGGQLYIQSNPSLATANFGSLSTTSEIQIIQNGLTSISFPALTASGLLNISDNASLATANFGSLSTAGGINIQTNGLTSISFPALTTVSGQGQLIIGSNASLATANFGSLSTAGSINIQSNGLTSISFPALTTMGGQLYIQSNPSLATANFGSLTTVSGQLNILSNASLTSANFGSLTTVSGTLYIGGNASLASANFGSLTTAGGGLVAFAIDGIRIESNGLTSISFPALTSINGQLNITGNASLATANFGNLTSVNYINIQSNGLTSISFPALTNVSTGLNISDNVSLAIANFGSLTTAGVGGPNYGSQIIYGITIQSNGLTSISFPALTTVSGQLNINSNASLASANFGNLSSAGAITITSNGLTSISFPALTTLSFYLNISSNASLSNINLSQQLNTNQLNQFDFYGNALPSSEINEILALLVANGTTLGSCIYLNNQNPPATPTGQGITDYVTLVNAGACISVD
jgi:hypothetical protein